MRNFTKRDVLSEAHQVKFLKLHLFPIYMGYVKFLKSSPLLFPLLPVSIKLVQENLFKASSIANVISLLNNEHSTEIY